MPSSLSMTWALYPNSTGRSMRPLRIGRASGSCRLTSRVAPSGHLPGQPGPGLGHHRGGPLDGDRQLAQRPPQPAAHPAAERLGQRAAAVAQHRGGLRRGLLRQVGQLPGHPADRPAALVPAQLGAGAQLGGDLAHPPGRGPPPVRHHGPGGPARRLHPPRRPHQLAHRLGQQPRIGRVGHVRADHRGIGPHPRGAQQLLPGRLGPQRLVQPGHRALPAPGGQLHQRRRMRHLGVQRDPAEPPPGDRVADLRAQALIAQPVPELEEHQPQVTLHRRGRPAEHRVESTARTARRTPGHPAAHPPAPAPPAAAAAPAAAATPTTTA